MTQTPSLNQDQLTFEVEGNGKFEFVVKNGKLVKLGDGTFGIVYEVFRRQQNEHFAIKLLYDNVNTRPKEIAHLSGEHRRQLIIQIRSSLSLSKDDEDTITTLIDNHTDDNSSLILKLSELKLTDWKQVAEALLNAAKSTAVERFLIEKEASRLIRKSQNHQGIGNYEGTEGTVDILCGVENVLKLNVYKQHLQAYFASQGVAISNYALIMDLHQYTLKDLLEAPRCYLQPAVLNTIFDKGRLPTGLVNTRARPREELLRQISLLKKEDFPQTMAHETLEDLQKRLRNAIVESCGYDLLKSLSMTERVNTALPFLKWIARGLSHLHTVNVYEDQIKLQINSLFHYDIKPANIFVTAPERGELVCALGDLGFLRPFASFGGGSIAPQHDEIPQGTLHYRSPEQKDYFDVANVTIVPAEASEGHSQDKPHLALLVRDPKFHNSFIEAGDIVIFSRDKGRNAYTIISKTQSNNGEARVIIQAPETLATYGGSTQVIFYKNPAYRTDMFGIGAVAYDMITCGTSPERFYESIKRFEYPEKGQILAVRDLVKKYESVREGQAQAEDPGLIQIFEPFRNGTDWLDSRVVGIILKCMLYRNPDTFYNNALNTTGKGSMAIQDLLEEIHALSDTHQSNAYTPHNRNNPLLTLTTHQGSADGHEDMMDAVIVRLQEGLDADDTQVNQQGMPQHQARRMAQAIYFLQKLADLIWKHAPQDHKTEQGYDPFLYQLVPTRIQWSKKNGIEPLSFRYPAYGNEADYQKDLLNDRLEKLSRDPANPFVPDQFAFMRRAIHLEPLEPEPDDNAGHLRFAYKFRDSSPFGDQLVKGDWIVLPQSQLWRIEEASAPYDRWIMVTHARNSDQAQAGTSLTRDLTTAHTGKKPISAFHYARIHPCRYYLDMLALYLHAMFFSYSPLTRETSNKISVEALTRHFPNSGQIKEPEQPRVRFGLGSKKILTLKYLYERLAYLFLRLSWHSATNAYFHKATNDQWREEVLQDVRNDIDALRQQFEDYFGVGRGRWKDDLPNVSQLRDDIGKEIDEAVRNPFEIRDLMVAMLPKP